MRIAKQARMKHVSIPTLPRRMTTRDAGFLYLERGNALLHIGCVAVLDGTVHLDALARRLQARIARLRRYAQRAAFVPFSLGHPTWEDDPDFDVRQHLHRWAVPSPGGESDLAELVAELLARPLPRDRPLWEMHLLEGLDGGRSALLQKVHHCMIDGVAGAQLLDQLLDPDPEARDPLPMPLAAPPPVPGPLQRIAGAAADTLLRQGRAASALVSALRRPAEAREAVDRLRAGAWSALQLAASGLPKLPWNHPLGPRRALWFDRLPMDGVRRIRRAHGGTVNDVVLTVLAGGLHRYLRSIGERTRGIELVALVPVSLRSAEEASTALGNRISALLVPLQVDPAHELPRLHATRAVTESLKQGGSWAGIDALLGALDELPAPLVALASKAMGLAGLANLIATNVPGPREKRWLLGREVQALYPIVPIIDGMGLGLAVFSYDGGLYIGLNADPVLVPDLEKLGHATREAFAELAG
jgi:WS/DGAT/MGAT family acyltransferase